MALVYWLKNTCLNVATCLQGNLIQDSKFKKSHLFNTATSCNAAITIAAAGVRCNFIMFAASNKIYVQKVLPYSTKILIFLPTFNEV